MARPRKSRKICALPFCAEFGPRGYGRRQPVDMALDEYEVIRLIDLEGLTQEECAAQMEVARTTVQSIYAEARKKIARCVVLGDRLEIGGGDVRMCQQRTNACGHGRCVRISKKLSGKEE